MDDDNKMLPLPGSSVGMGDLAVGDAGSTLMMGPSAMCMGNGGSTTMMGFASSMGRGNGGNGCSTPTSSGFGNGCSTPSCLHDLGKALALAVKVLACNEVME